MQRYVERRASQDEQSRYRHGETPPLPQQWTPGKLARKTAILGFLMQKDRINQRRYAAKEAWNSAVVIFRSARVRAHCRYACFAIVVLKLLFLVFRIQAGGARQLTVAEKVLTNF